MTTFTRIAMFSGPRNISTTIMRAFENRTDIAAYDEPFYAWYLQESGAPHPMREEILASLPCTWSGVNKMLETPPASGATIAFEKHMAFHFAAEASLDWIEQTRVVQLIRDPRAMVASYKNKYDDVSPIVDSLTVQRRIYDDCVSRGVPCPIIDSADLQKNPGEMLQALCAALNIPYTQDMLSWPAGPRDSDGVWEAHWYDAVKSSTGFRPYVAKKVELTPDLEAIAAQCQPGYDFFHKRRLTV